MSTSRVSSLLAITLFSVAACGSEGPEGDPGPMGTMGEMGTMGTPGTNGTNGNNGLACWDLNGNGACDMATEDTDDDNTCDVADCAGPQGERGLQGIPGVSGTNGQMAASVYGSAALTLSGTQTAFQLVPGLTQTITVPAGVVVTISTQGGIASASTTANGLALVNVAIVADGALFANGGFQVVNLASTAALPGTINYWNLQQAVTLAAGSHTIDVRVRVPPNITGLSDTTISGDANSAFQGALTITMIKL